MSITKAKRHPARLALQWGAAVVAVAALAAAMGFDDFFRTLLLGIPQGSIIALIAVGYSMVYGIILLINFAHGEIFMLSAYLVLMFLWSADEFPVRVPGMPLLVPAFTASLLAITSGIAFNTIAASTIVLRERGRRWGLAGAFGVVIGYLCYRSFLSTAWLGIFASIVAAGLGAFLSRTALGARDWGVASTTARGAVIALGAAVFGGACFALLRHQALFAGIVASCALTATIGVTLDTVAYRPLRTAPRLIPIITAIGMSICFQSLAQVIWGAEPQVYADMKLPAVLRPPDIQTPDGQWVTDDFLYKLPLGEQIRVGHSVVIKKFLFYTFEEPVRIPVTDLIIVALGLVVMVGLHLLIHKTMLGKSMRACSEDKTTARLVGVNVDQVVAATFIIGSVLAALVSPLWVIKYATVEPTMGLIVGILAFASAVLGGIGDVKGAMIGGMAIGVIYNFVPSLENFDTWAVVTKWGWVAEDTALHIYERYLEGLTQWRLGVAYAFMILVIIIKPTGLFGETSAKRA